MNTQQPKAPEVIDVAAVVVHPEGVRIQELPAQNVTPNRNVQFFHPITRQADLVDVSLEGAGRIERIMAGNVQAALAPGQKFSDIAPGGRILLPQQSFVTVIVKNESAEAGQAVVRLHLENEKEIVRPAPRSNGGGAAARGPRMFPGSVPSRPGARPPPRPAATSRAASPRSPTPRTVPTGSSVTFRIYRTTLGGLRAYASDNAILPLRHLASLQTALRSIVGKDDKPGGMNVHVTVPTKLYMRLLDVASKGQRLSVEERADLLAYLNGKEVEEPAVKKEEAIVVKTETVDSAPIPAEEP